MNNLKLTDKDTIRLVRQALRNDKPVYINRLASKIGVIYQSNTYRVIGVKVSKDKITFRLVDGSPFMVFPGYDLENYSIDIK